MATATGKTYYDVLGVSKDASEDEIRKAYLKLARQYHPDKTGGDKAAEEKLKEINNAYDTLKNKERRKEYDAQLAGVGAGFGGFRPGGGFGGGFGGGGEWTTFTEGAGAGGEFHTHFEDLFADLFGGGAGGARTRGARRGPRRGHHVEVTVPVTLQEAAEGVKKSIRVPGAESAEGKTISVSIPAGAETGTRLRLSGQGAPGEPGAGAGDLFVIVQVQPDDVFQRQGNDLICEAPVTYAEAALGATIRVPTVTGQADLRIPAGTQSGQTFRMRGRGMPSIDGGRVGDQLVRVQVEVPKRLSEEQRGLIHKLQELDASPAYPKRRAFEEKIKRRKR